MRINLVNPNTTLSMTAKIAAAARAVAAPGTEIRAVSPAMGPVSIEGHYDEAFCVPGLLEEIAKAEAEGFEGHVIACFDDPGLDAARELARGPVVGIAEAAMHVASLVAGGFTIVTTLPRSIPAVERLVERYGFARHCRRVRAAEIPVLALEEPGSPARERLRAEIARALSEDRCEAILLGCAGMADLAEALSAEFRLPVIDGVAAATKLVEALLGLGLATSKIGAWAPPRAKPYSGAFARFAPR
ncbi:MAG: aspartate/glutamate racemase family protein [Geminicoccaceae bacterium]|nr:aspartate/glutamate racemase family protein [Geminicoccaceae bacterium]MDW8370436.1 aspartate/glutamate racemase family protein [Geminicoccaceae bacterium]